LRFFLKQLFENLLYIIVLHFLVKGGYEGFELVLGQEPGFFTVKLPDQINRVQLIFDHESFDVAKESELKLIHDKIL